MIPVICGILIMAQMILFKKQKKIKDMESTLVVAGRRGEGSGIDKEFGVGRRKLLHLDWISNEVLHPTFWVRTWWKNVWKKECMCVCVYTYICVWLYICVCVYTYICVCIYVCVCVWLGHFAVQQKLKEHCKSIIC